MADFYKQQRQRPGILVDEDSQPLTGRWSFDEDSPKKLPKKATVPDVRWAPCSTAR